MIATRNGRSADGGLAAPSADTPRILGSGQQLLSRSRLLRGRYWVSATRPPDTSGACLQLVVAPVSEVAPGIQLFDPVSGLVESTLPTIWLHWAWVE